MVQTLQAPLTITPQAAGRIEALGVRREFERMIEHVRATMPRLRAIQVTLEPADYPEGWDTLFIRPERDEPDGDEDDPSDRDWLRWLVESFPGAITLHFGLSSSFVPRDGR